MFDLIFHAAIPLIVAVMVIMAVWMNRYWLRLTTIVTLLIILGFRESSIHSHARSIIWENRSTSDGDKIEGFANGVRAVADYCNDTSLLVYVVLVAILAISAKGFQRSKKGD